MDWPAGITACGCLGAEQGLKKAIRPPEAKIFGARRKVVKVGARREEGCIIYPRDLLAVESGL